MTPAELIARANEHGIRLRVKAGELRYSAAGTVPPDLRALLAEHKPALLAYLATWDPDAAIRLMSDADGEVERLGGRGSHPSIRDAAARAVQAYRLCNLPGVRAGCDEMIAAANRLAADGETARGVA